jgi:hypothetical protein
LKSAEEQQAAAEQNTSSNDVASDLRLEGLAKSMVMQK